MNLSQGTLYRLMNYFGGNAQQSLGEGAGGAGAHGSQETEGGSGQPGSGHAQGGGGGGDDDMEATTQANVFRYNNWGAATTPSSQGDDDGPTVTETPPTGRAPGPFSLRGNNFLQQGLGAPGFRTGGPMDRFRLMHRVPEYIIRRIQLSIYREMRSKMYDQLLQCVQEKLRDVPTQLPSIRNYNFMF